MAKFRHNKKKNTAFLYETLILELTKAILKRDILLKNQITKSYIFHDIRKTVIG